MHFAFYMVGFLAVKANCAQVGFADKVPGDILLVISVCNIHYRNCFFML